MHLLRNNGIGTIGRCNWYFMTEKHLLKLFFGDKKSRVTRRTIEPKISPITNMDAASLIDDICFACVNF